MGTNFYWREHDFMDHPIFERMLGEGTRDDEGIHIGKSSAGCTFSLHVYPDNEHLPSNLLQWRQRWMQREGHIFNEYGEELTVDEMMAKITHRGKVDELKRHEIDGRFCVGHGNGTWDELVGEFS